MSEPPPAPLLLELDELDELDELVAPPAPVELLELALVDDDVVLVDVAPEVLPEP